MNKIKEIQNKIYDLHMQNAMIMSDVAVWKTRLNVEVGNYFKEKYPIDTKLILKYGQRITYYLIFKGEIALHPYSFLFFNTKANEYMAFGTKDLIEFIEKGKFEIQLEGNK